VRPLALLLAPALLLALCGCYAVPPSAARQTQDRAVTVRYEGWPEGATLPRVHARHVYHGLVVSLTPGGGVPWSAPGQESTPWSAIRPEDRTLVLLPDAHDWGPDGRPHVEARHAWAGTTLAVSPSIHLGEARPAGQRDSALVPPRVTARCSE